MAVLVVSREKLSKIGVNVYEMLGLGDSNIEYLSVYPFHIDEKLVLFLVLDLSVYGVALCTGPVNVVFGLSV